MSVQAPHPTSRLATRRSSRRAATLTTVAALLYLGRNVHAEINVWTATSGPEGGAVHSLAVDPNTPSTLYAATNAGVFKSTDAGASWRASGSLTDTVLLAIDPLAPATLYAGTNGSLFKSTDAGVSWNALDVGAVASLAIDPRHPSTLYAGSRLGNVFKSTDGGASWSASENGVHGTSLPAVLAIDPKTPSTLYVAKRHGNSSPGQVFKSTDGGANWSGTGLIGGGNLLTDVYVLAIDPTTPSTLYAGANGGVTKTTDGGTTWSAANRGLPQKASVLALAIDPATPSTLYAVPADAPSQSGGTVFKSTDGGENWSASDTGLLSSNVITVAINPLTPATLYAGTLSDGVFKSDDGSVHWRASNTGLRALPVGALAIDPAIPSTLYAGTVPPATFSPEGQGVFKSTDRGTTWSSRNIGLPTGASITALAIAPVTSDIYAGGLGCSEGVCGNALFESTDGGASWSVSLGTGGFSVNALAIDPLTHGTLYAATYPGVVKTTDGGASWRTVLEEPMSSGLVVTAIAIDPQTPATLYAASPPFEIYGPRIFKSTDGGAGWNAISINANNMFSLVIDPSNPSTLYVGSNYPEVLRSTDAGASWGSVSTGLPNTSVLNALAIDPHHPRTLYAGYARSSGGDFGVFRSPDGGASWRAFNTGLADTDVRSLAIDPGIAGTVYAGTAGGVFAMQPETFTVDSTDDAPDADPADGICATAAGVCTLRAAVDSAHSGDVIFLPAGIYRLSDGVVEIKTAVTLQGAGATTTHIDGSLDVEPRTGGVGIAPGAVVTISDVTIEHAYGIDDAGTVTLTNCMLSNNVGFLVAGGSVGGGIYVGSGSTATLTNCTMDHNSAQGGAVFVDSGGTATLTNCTLANNFAPQSSGGGAIYIADNGAATLTNCTVNFNAGEYASGGIDTGGTVRLTNTIVADNYGGGSTQCRVRSSGMILSGGHNLSSDSTCFTSPDLVNTDPHLAPLADYGGPTETVALCTAVGVPDVSCTAGSPAIDAGDDAVTGPPLLLTTDQRNRPRKAGLHVDIGAYEAKDSATPLCVGDCSGTSTVAINDLITLVNIALDNAQASACPQGVPDGTTVDVTLIIQAVANALNGCRGG